VCDPERWLHPDVRFAVQCASDSEGLAPTRWSAGGHVAPRAWFRDAPGGMAGARRTAVGEVLDGVLAGEEVDVEEIRSRCSAHAAPTSRGSRTWPTAPLGSVGDTVTFVRNRNINYNEHLHVQVQSSVLLEGAVVTQPARRPHLLGLDELQRRGRGRRTRRHRGVPAGRDPSRLDGNYYLEVARAPRRSPPTSIVHGFTASR